MKQVSALIKGWMAVIWLNMRKKIRNRIAEQFCYVWFKADFIFVSFDELIQFNPVLIPKFIRMTIQFSTLNERNQTKRTFLEGDFK